MVKNVALFILIQLVSLVLTLVGLVILIPAAAFQFWGSTDNAGAPHWRSPLLWVWDNQEDGVCAFWQGPITRWRVYYWAAIRNPCNNLRYVPGVSSTSRPLWRTTWGKWYAQAGWNHSGFPVLSAGRNIHPW